MFGYKKVTKDTCLHIHSQKERDDLGFIESHRDRMPYIKDLVNTIHDSAIDGKISTKDRSKCLKKFWSLMKASQSA